MSEEMVNVELNLGKELANKINRMTKKELINCMVVDILRNRVQDETIALLESKLQRTNNLQEKTQIKLDLAESYVAQARAMIDSLMDRWNEYDV